MQGQRGEEHYNWKGGSRLRENGYRFLHMRGHPLADAKSYVREHRLVAQEALGKPLPPKAVLHHVNGVKDDNRGRNLVLCEDTAYHRHLDKRIRAFRGCGHADWVQCRHCKEWTAPAAMYVHPRGLYAYHNACFNEYQKAGHARRRKERA